MVCLSSLEPGINYLASNLQKNGLIFILIQGRNHVSYTSVLKKQFPGHKIGRKRGRNREKQLSGHKNGRKRGRTGQKRQPSHKIGQKRGRSGQKRLHSHKIGPQNVRGQESHVKRRKLVEAKALTIRHLRGSLGKPVIPKKPVNDW